MSKEKIKVIESGHTTIIAENPRSERLIEKIQELKEENPSSLIEVRTPMVTGSQVEALFEAGAVAWRMADKKDKQ